VKADVMVGHSTGESSALAASGAIGYGDMSQLTEFIRKLNNIYQNVLDAGNIPTGSLLAVGALSRETVEKLSTDVDKDIVIAMENCPNQLVLFGSQKSIEIVQNTLGEAGGICRILPFDRGYHTPLFSAVSEAFLNYYEKIQLKAPDVPLYSCSTADLFPDDVATIKKTAAIQWSTEVRFAQTVSAMHRDGVRYFIEVGPSGNLSTFVNDILAGRDFLTLPTNIRRKNSIEQLLFVLAHLFVNNKKVQLDSLFAFRSINSSNLQSLKTVKNQGMALKNTMPIIHLDKTDGDELRRLLYSSLEPPVIPESEGASLPLMSVDELHPDEPAETYQEAKSHVMSDYFCLMHDFLDRQNTFMTKLSPGGADSSVEPVLEEAIAPLLHVVTALDDHHCRAECHFSVFEDNFLKNHILSGPVSEIDRDLLGLSCVPLMVSLEIMAEACALVAGNKAVTVIENIRAFGWIALDENSISLNVEAEIIPADPPKYKASLFNNGNEIVTAEFSFEPQWTLSSLEPLARRRKLTWQDNELYTTGMFHGPLFQSVTGIEGWDELGIDARLSNVSLDGFVVENETPDLLLNPVLLDAVGQLAAFWIAQQVGTNFNCFPSTIERIELYQRCPQNIQGLSLGARQQPLDVLNKEAEHQMNWHFECLDGDGRVMFRISNLTNVYYQVPYRFYTFRRDPLNGRLGKLNQAFQDDGIVLWELHHLSEKFCSQSEGIFLRILASALLGFDERALWFQLAEKNIRHKRQWLLGRACIKEAVQWWVHQQTGKWLYPADIIVLHDELGAPYVDGWWRDRLVEAPEVSLSHDQRMSVAAVSSPENTVGVDVEQIGRIRHPDAVVHSLNEHEQLLLKGLDKEAWGETLLYLLCSKEAAAKCLGLGLQGQPEKYAVHLENGDWQRCLVVLDEAVVNVKIHREQDTIIALATGQVHLTRQEEV
jgi:malonyl CoA-acyl carrier protein transacylase/phosphopantetheinyl transferase (holo-ACP synthase)